MNIGDHWRNTTNEQLAELLTTFMFSICTIIGVDTTQMNSETEKEHLIKYLDSDISELDRYMN